MFVNSQLVSDSLAHDNELNQARGYKGHNLAAGLTNDELLFLNDHFSKDELACEDAINALVLKFQPLVACEYNLAHVGDAISQASLRVELGLLNIHGVDQILLQVL